MRAALKAVQNSPFSNKSGRFTTKYRLLQKQGFNHVVKARSISDKYFRIFFECNKWKNARLGIIASKRMLPKAVDRNRAKRTVREAFRQHSIKDSRLDIVVMLKHPCAQQSATQRDNLDKLFSRVGDQCAES